jgi:hypothetical protein
LITPDMVRGKKIVAISGSGRGDFVGERAKQLSEHLKATGRNDVLIIGAAAGGAEDAAKLTQGLDNVVILPSMPRKKFVDVLRGSDLHYGSSGASSFAESMMSGNRFVLPRSWSEMEDQVAKPLRQQHGLHPLEGSWSKKWLDKVNAGQLQHAQNRGVPLIDPTRPEELLKILDDPSHSHAAMGRAQRYMRELDLAQPRFKEMMKDFLGRAESAHKAKAIMTIASSLPFIAAGGYGLYKYVRSGEKMKKSAAKEEKKPDPIGTASSGAGIAGLAAAPMIADFSPEARLGKDTIKYMRQGAEYPSIVQQVGNVLKSNRNKAALISALLGTGALGYGMLRKPERTKTAAFLIRSAMYNESVRR